MYEKEKSEIQRLKQHILTSLPSTLDLSSDSVAITAAIAGLDKETSRLEREEKLIHRFKAASSDTNEKADDVDMEYVKMSKADIATEEVHDDEWMEATDSSVDEAQKWVSAVIARISSGNVKVESSLGALGLVLHSALLELYANGNSTKGKIQCTGIPPEDVLYELSVSKGGVKPKVQDDGFAPPVRELPNGQLVPAKWEEGCTSSSPRVAFRYRCGKGEYSTDVANTDASTLYLLVEPKDDHISMYFGPLAKERKRMTFKLDSYINLDGMRAALEKSTPTSPVLFYKSLKVLLLSFANEFGLDNAMKATFGEGVPAAMEAVPVVDVLSEQAENTRIPSQTGVTTRPVDTCTPVDPLRVDSTHTGRRNRGDFEGDLLPGGPLQGPDFAHGPHVGGGSQVGPNHPLFDRTFGEDTNHGYGDDLGFDESGPSFRVPGTGGFEMRPRFDPFGPPGGPTEPGRGLRSGRGRGRGGRGGRGRAPLGGFGFPNPDHMQPPGGDYFS